MLPAGETTEQTVLQLGDLLDRGDIIIEAAIRCTRRRCTARANTQGKGGMAGRLPRLPARRIGGTVDARWMTGGA
jgi:hypothetical protein